MKIKRILSLLLAIVLLFVFVTSNCIVSQASTITTNGNGGKTDVGAWFVTYNTQTMWSNNFGTGLPIKHRVLLPDGTYGLPDSRDINVIDFQIKELADAKIDFILFDITNGGLTEKIPYGWDGNQWIVETAQLTCERIKLWNEKNDWKIKYAIGIGVYANLRKALSIGEATEYQAEAILEKFYHKYGEDNYYQVNGKPLIILHDFGIENPLTMAGGWNMYSVSSKTDHDAGDQFTVRGSLSTPKESTGYAWYTPQDGTIVTEESVTVSPGQWNHNNSTPNTYRMDGKHYIDDWKRVIESEIVPGIVLISSFNDYNEETAVFTADTSQCNPEWTDLWKDDTGNLNPSMYWEITKEGIAMLRDKNKDSFADLKGVVSKNSRSWFSEKKQPIIPDFELNFTVVLVAMISFFVVILIATVIIVAIGVRKKKILKL